jgi:hypothetical protein
VSATSAPARLTFEDILDREPIVADLWSDVKAVRRVKDFCANAVWYGYFGRTSIRERIAYLETKYGHIVHSMVSSQLFNALPDCKGNCLCSRFG